jgi:hypothetical protein
MTKKEQATSLLARMSDKALDTADRKQAWAELQDLKKSAKMSWEKLLGDEEVRMGRITKQVEALPDTDPLDEAIMPEQKAKKPKVKADTERGMISAMVRNRLLHSDDGYAQIVEDVHAAFPKAKTTARSVASVASELRRKGEKVAIRRKPAGDKE